MCLSPITMLLVLYVYIHVCTYMYIIHSKCMPFYIHMILLLMYNVLLILHFLYISNVYIVCLCYALLPMYNVSIPLFYGLLPLRNVVLLPSLMTE